MSGGNIGYRPGRSLQFFTPTATPLQTPDDLIFDSHFLGPEVDKDDFFTDSQPIDDWGGFSDELAMNIGCVPDSEAPAVDRDLGPGFLAFLKSSLPAWDFGVCDGKEERHTADKECDVSDGPGVVTPEGQHLRRSDLASDVAQTLLRETPASAFVAGDDKGEGPIASPMEVPIVSPIIGGEVGSAKASIFYLLRRRRSKSSVVVAPTGTNRQQGPDLTVDVWAEFEQSPIFRALRGWVYDLGNRSFLPPKKRFKVAATGGLKPPYEGFKPPFEG